MKIRILPASDTFDSNEVPLLAGEVYTAPGDISEDDALICIIQGKAEEVDDDGNPVAPPVVVTAEDESAGAGFGDSE